MRSSPFLQQVVNEVISAERDTEPHADALRFLVKRGVGLTLKDRESYSLLGNHRVGGMPDLPPAIPYPRFPSADAPGKSYAYEFLCQIDCAAVATAQDYLPRTGFLYFFLSTLHDLYGSGDERAARVLWYDGARESLVSGAQLRVPQEHQASLVLKGAPEEWTILFHVTSCGDFQWGDAGDLFFVAHKSDVALCDFSRVFCTLESS